MSECSLSKEKFISVARAVETLEAEKKELVAEIKEQIESCSEEYNIDVKPLKKAIKEFLRYEKDKALYLAETNSVDQILINAMDKDSDSEEDQD